MKRRLLVASLVVGVGVPVLGLSTYSAVQLRTFERVDVRRTTSMYAAGQALSLGVHVGRIGLAGTLARLDYTETGDAPTEPGQFSQAPDAWDIFVRGSETSGARRVHLRLESDRIVSLASEGLPVETVRLEPEVLTSVIDQAGEHHKPVRLAETPQVVVDAVLAAEDHRFFHHRGIDLYALVRAAWSNVRAGRIAQGGSTITQQLVKNRLLSSERTLVRKLTEAWLATLVEWRYSKEQILEAYLNEVYLGQRGGVVIRGVGAASRAYFGKELRELRLGETALLAGMIRAPNTYSPVADRDHARARRDVVLRRMRELGRISATDHRRAQREAVRIEGAAGRRLVAPYFVDHVRRELEDRFGADAAVRREARIFTTLDLPLQRMAEAAVTRGLDRLETHTSALRRSDGTQRLQAALVVVDATTGHILALVGGRDHTVSQFNRATLARRQPGSAFKPFVYLAALRVRAGRPAVTAASLVDDAPITVMVDGAPWRPRNYEDRYEGQVSVRRALEQSLNAATVRVAEHVGLPAVIEMARALGLRAELKPVPAMTLGALEVTPLDLAAAYVPLASGGVRPAGLFGIAGVSDAAGPFQAETTDAPTQVLSPAEAYLMTSLLQGATVSGTGAGAAGFGLAGIVAGKTGTTNDGRDAWFVGYTPRLLAVVWVGFDNGDPLHLSGAQAALPIWADFMRQAVEAYPQPQVAAPSGIVFRHVDPTSGKRANVFCPLKIREVFLEGTEPPPCDVHGGIVAPILDWWMRLRDRFGR